MQGKGLSLRLSLVTLVVVLIFGTLGGFSLARDAFDADYDDCPAATRLDSVGGLTIDRTDEEDEIRVSWDALDSADLSSLGPNGYRARLTVIVDGEDARNVALGDTALVVSEIDFAEDLTVSVAITLGDYVISDIAEAEFTSGLPAPRFSSDVWVSGNIFRGTFTTATSAEFVADTESDPGDIAEIAADRAEVDLLLNALSGHPNIATFRATYETQKAVATPDGETFTTLISDLGGALTTDALEVTPPQRTAARRSAYQRVIDSDNIPKEDAGGKRDLGTFYYLGFNDLFDNWFVRSGGVRQRPITPKFRVGLQHGASGVAASDADFENYRIVIEDSSGDLLGYQAETVSASGTYGSNKIVFASQDIDVDGGLEFLDVGDWGSATNFTNIRLSNRVTDDGAVSPYYGTVADTFRPPATSLRDDLSFGNVGLVNASTNAFPVEDVLYADSPVEYFDFPSDVFESDGSYTIKAWAEDGDGTRISPQASIVLGAQEGESAEGAEAGVTEYANGIRNFNSEENVGNRLTVYGLSIQDE